CPFTDSVCGWNKNATLNQKWTLGRGRVINPENLTFTEEVASRDMLYSDFTDLEANSEGVMELYSEVIPQIPRIGACFILYHNVKAIDLKTDQYEVFLQTWGSGKWNVTTSLQTNQP